MNLEQIENGALLAIGKANWNLHLEIFTLSEPERDARKRKRYYNVRAIAKADKPGCKDSGFGDVFYFHNFVSLSSDATGNKPELTEAGKAIMKATRAEIRELEQA